jgi:phosphatidylglycerol:prolipoprotein diacylglycerol transferase
VIPYLHIPSLFGIIQPFGVLVVCGIFLGTYLAAKYVERNGMDEETNRWLGVRLIVWGFLACHLFNVVFYEWDRLWGIGRHAAARLEPGWIGFDWKMVLNPFDGISSWGGLVGGAIAFFVYTKKAGLGKLRWADAMAMGAVGGWVPGRAACAVAHDHTAGATDFILGIKVPADVAKWKDVPGLVKQHAGQTIHDLGWYEFLILLPILGIMLLLARLPDRKPGMLMGAFAVIYSIPRFFIDFLRLEQTDPRYGGLTFAQWCCLVALALGITLLLQPREKAAAAGKIDLPDPRPVPAPAGGQGKGKKKR